MGRFSVGGVTLSGAGASGVVSESSREGGIGAGRGVSKADIDCSQLVERFFREFGGVSDRLTAICGFEGNWVFSGS